MLTSLMLRRCLVLPKVSLGGTNEWTVKRVRSMEQETSARHEKQSDTGYQKTSTKACADEQTVPHSADTKTEHRHEKEVPRYSKARNKERDAHLRPIDRSTPWSVR